MNNLNKSNSNNTENRIHHLPPRKHLNFRQIKHNTICSLNEVEYFLNNFNQFIKYVRLYKILK